MAQNEIPAIQNKYLDKCSYFLKVGFGLIGAQHIDKPSNWEELKNKSLETEASLHTFLHLNLEALTGEKLKFNSSSLIQQSNIDLTAVDKLERVHIFEVKRNADQKTLQQITQYLMSLVLINKDQFLKFSSKSHHEQDITALKKLFLGVYHDRVIKTKDICSLEKDICSEYSTFPEEYTIWQNNQSREFTPYKKVTCSNPFTLWIAANEINWTKIYPEIIKIRSLGIDIRLLKIDVRRDLNNYFIQVEREIHPLNEKINKELESLKNQEPMREYFLRYYTLQSASSPTIKGAPITDLKKAMMLINGQEKDFDTLNMRKRAFFVDKE